MTRSTRGNMGIRIIVFMGAATFLFLLLVAFGLKKSIQPPEGNRIEAGTGTSPFEESRVRKFLAESGAPAEAAGPDKALTERLAQGYRNAGLSTRVLEDAGVVAAMAPGELPGAVVLVADPGEAGSLPWLIEMARILERRVGMRPVWLVAVPSERSLGLAAALRELKVTPEQSVVLYLGGLGDCQLGIQRDAESPEALTDIVWNTARRHQYQKAFGALPAPPRAIPVALREAGYSVLSLVDGSKADPGEAPCPESLRAVGDVIYHALAPIEGLLDGTGLRDDGH